MEMAREVVADLGVDAEVREIEVHGVDDAKERRFLGSPSIRVDGIDIEPTAHERKDFGFSCRTYSGSGLPSRELLVAALNDGSPLHSSGGAD